MDLGKLGVWTTYRRIEEDQAGEAAALAEQLGYGTFWLGGSPRLPSVRPLLEATESIVVATSIVNIWTYDPGAARGRVRGARARLPGTVARRHRSRPPGGDERLLEAVLGDAGVPGRCRRGSDADPPGAPLPGGTGAEDGRPERRALARLDSVLHARRAHERRPRAARSRPAGRPGGRIRARLRRRARPRHGARVRAALPRGEQLHEQPAQAGIQPGGHRRRRLRPA